MNNFQTILIAVFLSCFVFAVFIFSGAIKIGESKKDQTLGGRVTIWGTFPSNAVADVINDISSTYRDLSISYIQKDYSIYQQELIESFANSKGPDLFIIDPSMIKRNNNFIYKIPFASYSQTNFNNSFIEGADVYLLSEGVAGFPLIVDPIVLYYNKDLLSNEGIVNPPTTWGELVGLNKILTKKDDRGVISQSMIALGQYANVNNAKDILSTLLIQNNNPIVSKTMKKIESSGSTTENETEYLSVLGENPLGFNEPPAESILRFFLEFSDLSKTTYSWNRSLPNSLEMFTGGKSAFYLGRASELFEIESLNPNLSFDVTSVPQVNDTNPKRTYGEIYAVVINKKSQNLPGSFGVASFMSSGDNAKNLSVSLSLPPVLKSLLANKPVDNPYLNTFFNSALISRAWTDPDRKETDLIFREMVENVLSNKLKIYEAVDRAEDQLELLINK